MQLIDTMTLQWIDKFRKHQNQNVVVMLSGGKDSCLCLALLKKLNINVKAIHFMHRWSWPLVTNEAKRICSLLNIKLHIFDITEDFETNIAGKIKGRPCGVCKTIMDQKIIDFCLKNNISWICSGDNATNGAVTRIINFEKARNNTNIFIGKYLDCVEKGFPVPESINILHPIIKLTPEDVESILINDFGISIERVHELGDKYLTYWREGCPLQYIEEGTVLSLKIMNNLFKANKIITNFARKHNIRAAMFMPSKKVVTIPKGFEDKLINLVNIKKFDETN